MVQGTTSDAGKSVLVTALGRILARKGIAVAPFKSQNMALNSAVTKEGGEIGRAQAAQAEACGLEASILMNPILLKPNSELGAQVIVNGQAIGNMKASEYHQLKPKLLTKVVAAHDELARQFEVVLVEGAGSPAEINLRQHDIANMGFAEAIDCPVIIVCDIDRGGVFAHLYGTWALLSKSEQSRIQGFVINRFRGDASLLDSGIEWLQQKTGVPVLAVIPYIESLHIEAEDSLSQNQKLQTEAEKKQLKVAVVQYPRASNHTDFDVLRMHPQIDCTFYKSPQECQQADLIILPGSKNVRGDLDWLKQQGWAEKIQQHLRYGGKLIGVCGGYQMLGQWIHDPNAIEAEAGSSKALALLDIETTLTEQKQLKNVSGVSLLSQSCDVTGYEIHAGVTTGPALKQPLFQLGEGFEAEGVIDPAGQILGSYLHGLFDSPEFFQQLVAWAGLEQIQSFDYRAYRLKEIDRLADVVEQALPYSVLMQLLGFTQSLE
ncbi:cobyric acid synthase [Reinekea thalattae]|uniref:Cobyric acid synthase n=2 Tax=Reinekea thalattae TaxID=2593301 RepID=A0A5C8ZCD1_9GAMM|nr:cobyric acid synthase [Reinekea thalattae]